MAFTNLWKVFVRDGGNENDEREDDYYRPQAKEENKQKSGTEESVTFHGVRRREPALSPINTTTDERVEDVEDDEETEETVVPQPIDMTAPREEAAEAAEEEAPAEAPVEEEAPAQVPAEEEVPAEADGEETVSDDDLYGGQTVAVADPDDEPDGTDTFTDNLFSEVPAFKLIHITDLSVARHAIDLLAEGYVVIADTSPLDEDMLANMTCFLAGAVYALDGHIYPADETNAFLSLEEFDPTPYLPADEDEQDEGTESADTVGEF